MQTKRKRVATIGSRFLRLFSILLCGLALFAARSVEGATSSNVVSLELLRPEIPEPAAGSTITFPFLFKRTGPTNTPLVVTFVYAGTATRGVDYMGSNTVMIPSGASQYQFFPLYILAGDVVEGDETIVAELIAPGSNPEYAVHPENNRASVLIRDYVNPEPNLPVVQVEAVQNTTWEPITGGPDGAFRIWRGGPLDQPLTVHFDFSGSAMHGLDYQALTNPIVFTAGESEVFRFVEALEDDLVEGDELVIMTLLESSNYHLGSTNYANVFIRDPDSLPTVSIEASQPFTREPFPVAEPGLVTVRRTGPTNTSLAVHAFWGGAARLRLDYDANTNDWVFAPGQTVFTREVTPLADDLAEGDEAMAVQLIGLGGVYNTDPEKRVAWVTIVDEDTTPPTNIVVSISSRMDAEEPASGTTGYYTFGLHRTGPTNTALTVLLRYEGSATLGLDYSVTNVIVMPPGAVGYPFGISVHADDVVDMEESIIAVVAPSSAYVVHTEENRAVSRIHDEDQPAPTNVVVSIETRMDISEPIEGSAGFYPFQLVRTGPTNTALPVFLTYSGTATSGSDYTITNIVNIPPGAREFPWFILRAHADDLVEGDETVVAEIFPSNLYTTDHLNRATAVIHDQDGPAPTNIIVSIEARTAQIAEPAEGSSGQYPFLLRRTGPTNGPTVVAFRFDGTATQGLDYSMTNVVVIPPGAREFPWFILRAHADQLAEPDETIIVEILPSAFFAIDAAHSHAVVSLVDGTTPGSPVATILRPGNGSVFTEGDVISIFAIGTDPDGIVRKLEILADGHLLASVNTNNVLTLWTNAPLGLHELVARATDNNNNVVDGAPVSILVRGRDASAFVFRRLPDAYTPGVPFQVVLRAEPLADVRAYAVEDQPPRGWEVNNVSDEGAFDPITGKVKFGPFPDRSPRRLSYTLTPPVNATGTHEFSGQGSVDGTSYRIAGDRLIEQGTTQHPADVNPADFRMVLDEVTAYAAAWKASPSNNVPVSYVTRAGYLWKKGESYNFQPSAGSPPLCWVPFGRFEAPLSAAAAESGTIRFIHGTFEPGLPVETEIWIRPPSGTWAVAVEEQIPNGWTVGTISDGGIFDEGTGTIRWGVFLDDSDRSLRYTLKPPMNLVRIGRVRGLVSFDGINQEIAPQRVVSVNEEKLPVLESVERGTTGVKVRLAGEPGQVGVLQRSADLLNWTDVTTLFLPDGTLEYVDENVAGPRLYYRLQIR